MVKHMICKAICFYCSQRRRLSLGVSAPPNVCGQIGSYERIGGEGVLCRVHAQHALDEVLSRLRRLGLGRQIDFVLALQEGASALRSEGLKFGSVFGMMCVG